MADSDPVNRRKFLKVCVGAGATVASNPSLIAQPVGKGGMTPSVTAGPHLAPFVELLPVGGLADPGDRHGCENKDRGQNRGTWKDTAGQVAPADDGGTGQERDGV